jgi:hypothetical protein
VVAIGNRSLGVSNYNTILMTTTIPMTTEWVEWGTGRKAQCITTI